MHIPSAAKVGIFVLLLSEEQNKFRKKLPAVGIVGLCDLL